MLSEFRVDHGEKPDGLLTVWVGAEPMNFESTGTLDVGAWTCIELALGVDDANGSVSLSVDGEQVLNESGFDSLPADPYRYALLENGHSAAESPAAFEAVVDELAVATAPIGCE